MGKISSEINKIRNDDSLTDAEKAEAEAYLRANSLAFNSPKAGQTISWDVYSFKFTEEVTVENNMVRINGELRKNGQLVTAASPPFYFYNPPYMVKSPTAEGEYTVVGPEGEQVMVEDPRTALIEVLKEFVSQF